MTFLLDRRRLLIGLAAASTAAVSPVAAHVAAPVEHPELLALGDKLDAAVAETAAARDHKRAVIARWRGQWPSAPAAVCDGHAIHSSHDGERGLTGDLILASGASAPSYDAVRAASFEQRRDNPDAYYPRCVGTAEWFASRRDNALTAIRRHRPRHPLSALDVAQLEIEAALYGDKAALAAAYEAECERVRKASGYAEAVARDKAAFHALAALVGAIIATPADTMAGVMVKAQALAAWEAEPLHIAHVQSWGWSGAFAADVLRIASAAA